MSALFVMLFIKPKCCPYLTHRSIKRAVDLHPGPHESRSSATYSSSSHVFNCLTLKTLFKERRLQPNTGRHRQEKHADSSETETEHANEAAYSQRGK